MYLLDEPYRLHELRRQVIMLVFFSFFFYGAVAFGLWHDCLNQFESPSIGPAATSLVIPGQRTGASIRG